MSRFEIFPNDLIMSCSGTMGKIAIVPNGIKRGIINQALLKLTPNSNISNKYLKWLIASSYFQKKINELSGGAAIQNVPSVSILKKIKIPLPPLPIQQKIVAKLDKIFAEIDKAIVTTEINIKNCEAYFLNFLSKIFNNSTNVKNISEVLKLQYGKGLKHSDRNSKGLYPAYGSNGIKTLTDKYLFDKPSIIVGRKGSAGELTLVKEKFWPLDVTYYVTHDDEKTDINFLFYALQQKKLNLLAKGVKPGINRNEIYALKIYVPSINQQKLIVEKLNSIKFSIDRIISLYLNKCTEFSKLKESILQQAFNGELVKAA
jgi:type I restriction enzyme S subunit